MVTYTGEAPRNVGTCSIRVTSGSIGTLINIYSMYESKKGSMQVNEINYTTECLTSIPDDTCETPHHKVRGIKSSEDVVVSGRCCICDDLTLSEY